MEPNKMEKDFKRKLDARTIEPSAQAWDRLDAMLSVAEKKKRKPVRIWWFAAASIVAALFTGALFFKQDAVINTQDNTTVVVAPEFKYENTQKPKETLTSVTNKSNVPALNANPEQISNYTIAVTENTEIVTEQSNINQVADKTNSKVEKENSAYKYTNVDNLLAEAEAASRKQPDNILNTSSIKKQTVKVDSHSLLSSIEGELDETFRDKALQTITKNFNVVKTSLANRNYE